MSVEPLRAFPKDKITKKEFRAWMNAKGFKVSFVTVSFEDLARDSKITPIVSKDGQLMPKGILAPGDFAKWGEVITFCNNHRIIK